jgi:hypothetical protein
MRAYSFNFTDNWRQMNETYAQNKYPQSLMRAIKTEAKENQFVRSLAPGRHRHKQSCSTTVTKKIIRAKVLPGQQINESVS